MVPLAFLPALLVIATTATIIASQAVITVTIDVANRAKLPAAERVSVETFGEGIFRERGCYGFMEIPDVPENGIPVEI